MTLSRYWRSLLARKSLLLSFMEKSPRGYLNLPDFCNYQVKSMELGYWSVHFSATIWNRILSITLSTWPKGKDLADDHILSGNAPRINVISHIFLVKAAVWAVMTAMHKGSVSTVFSKLQIVEKLYSSASHAGDTANEVWNFDNSKNVDLEISAIGPWPTAVKGQ
jgi:hypothetical protein